MSIPFPTTHFCGLFFFPALTTSCCGCGVTVAADFSFGLVKGLTSYLVSNEDKSRLAKQLYLLCNESPLDANRPLDSFFDSGGGRFQPYLFDAASMEITADEVWLSVSPSMAWCHWAVLGCTVLFRDGSPVV